MKKIIVLISFVSLIFSCTMQIESPVSVNYDEFGGREDLGTAVINLPAPAARAIDAGEAGKACDIYEIVIYNDQKKAEALVRTYPAGPGEQLRIILPADEYRIIVLAGKKYKPSENVDENIFVGSGWADNVIVKIDCTTDVSIKIRPYAVNLNIPDIVYLNEIGEYTAGGGSYNPFLELEPQSFVGFDNKGNQVCFGLGSGHGDGGGNGWFFDTGHIDPMPEEPAEWDLYLRYCWFIFSDVEFYFGGDVNDFTKGHWKAPYASALASTPIPPVPFEEELHKHISFRSRQGINVTVGW